MRGKAVIAGIGHTAFGKQPGRSTVSLNIEAYRNAVADAGIEKNAVDGLLVKVPTSKVEMMYGQKLAEAMGMSPRFGGVFDQGGASNISMIAIAAMAIEAVRGRAGHARRQPAYRIASRLRESLGR